MSIEYYIAGFAWEPGSNWLINPNMEMTSGWSAVGSGWSGGGLSYVSSPAYNGAQALRGIFAGIFDFTDWSAVTTENYTSYSYSTEYGNTIILNSRNNWNYGTNGANMIIRNQPHSFMTFLDLSFDYLPMSDYWYDDDFTDTQMYVGIYAENTARVLSTAYWNYSQPVNSMGLNTGPHIKLGLHKISNLSSWSLRGDKSWVSISSVASGYTTKYQASSLSGMSGDSNHYRLLINWSTARASVWVNSSIAISNMDLSSTIVAAFSNKFKIIPHFHYYHDNYPAVKMETRILRNFVALMG